jgi:glutaredoxin
MQVVVVSRRGCHLCDEALELVRELGVDVEVADVDDDEALFSLYDWRVPVVLADGAVVAEGRIDRERLRLALRSPRLER